MDYRRKYLRRLANQNQPNQNDEKTNSNKIEENNIPRKPEQNIQNIYLQRLLVKNANSPTSASSINISSVNKNLPSFATNIRDILTTEENKQKAIKYVIHKRNDLGSRSPLSSDNEQPESNPVLSNNYYTNSRNLYENYGSNRNDVNNNKNNIDNKTAYPHYYARRNKNFSNAPQENNNQNLKNENNNNGEENNTFMKKRFQVSASAKNIIINNNDNEPKDQHNNTIYFRRNKLNSQNINDNNNVDNNNKSVSKDKNDKNPPRHKYLRYSKNNDNEQNDQNPINKELIKQKDKKISSIPINLKTGYNSYEKQEETSHYNYDIKVNRKRSKDFEEKKKI